MNRLGMILVLVMQVAKPAPPAGLPEGSGVYFKAGDGQWTQIQPASLAKANSRGAGLYLDSEGQSNLHTTAVYPSANAATQFSTPRPVFCVRGAGRAEDAVILQLTRKRNSREISSNSADRAVDNKGGFANKDIRAVTTILYSDGSFSVTPEDDLKPGEYLLFFGQADASFDFGIRSAKK